MAKSVEAGKTVSWSTLINGIFSDVAQLFTQELAFAKLEVRENIRGAKAFIGFLILGWSIVAVGFLMILMMLAYLLNANTRLPLWGCFGTIGGTTLLVGIVFLIWANKKQTDVDFIPQRAAEAVKEDIGWIRSSIKISNSVKRQEQH